MKDEFTRFEYENGDNTQRTVPGYAGVRGSATNSATVTVNGISAWRLGEYIYGGDDVENAASAVMKELDVTAVVNPTGTNEADLVQSVTGRVFVAQSPEAFTHDDDGNLTQDGRFIYTWDGENRLIAVETRADLPASVPRVKVTYQYDPRSRRIGKEVSNLEGETWAVAEFRTFLYDGWNMIAETSGTNAAHYIWGLDVSGSRQGAGGVGGLLAVVKGTGTYHPAFDGNGNVCEYTSADGSIVAHYEYSPFGETVIQSGTLADTFAFRFSTKYWEDEAMVYYYGYRFYVPESGRWLNRDPIGVVGGVNLMGFSRNAGITFVDLLGMICEGEIWYDISFDDVNPYTLEPQQPLPPPDPHPYVPDTSDGFSFSEAVFAYYFGQGNDVTVPFSVIDQGYGIGDFSGFDPCSYPVGAHEIEPVNKLHDMLSWKTLDQGGPGRIVFELNGSMTMDSYGKWSFSGTVSARADRFNFDPKDRFGERDGKPSWQQQLLEVLISGPKNCLSLRDRRYRFITYPKESITRLVHDLDQNTPLKGQEFDVNIVGNRSITAEGCCEK